MARCWLPVRNEWPLCSSVRIIHRRAFYFKSHIGAHCGFWLCALCTTTKGRAFLDSLLLRRPAAKPAICFELWSAECPSSPAAPPSAHAATTATTAAATSTAVAETSAAAAPASPAATTTPTAAPASAPTSASEVPVVPWPGRAPRVGVAVGPPLPQGVVHVYALIVDEV